MKKTLLSASAILLALSSMPALAADSGFYAGVTAGYTNTDTDYSDTTGISANADVKGADFGVLGGYRRYFANKFFLGGEGEVTFSTADDTVNILGAAVDVEKNHSYAVYVKPGYQFTDKFAAFGIFGWKWSEYELSVPAGSLDKRFNGFAFGAGVEYAFTPSISLSGEYNRVAYGKETDDIGGGNTETYDPDENIVKVALKYHF